MAKKKTKTKEPSIKYDIDVTNNGKVVVLKITSSQQISFDQIHAIIEDIQLQQSDVDGGMN